MIDAVTIVGLKIIGLAFGAAVGILLLQFMWTTSMLYWHYVCREIHLWRDRPYCKNCQTTIRTMRNLERLTGTPEGKDVD